MVLKEEFRKLPQAEQDRIKALTAEFPYLEQLTPEQIQTLSKNMGIQLLKL